MLNVVVVYGGFSREEEISHNSAKCILATLDRKKYFIHPVLIEKSRWNHIWSEKRFKVDKTDFSFLTPLGEIRPDVVYIMIHGTPGEDGLLQGYFDMVGIPYTTCSAFTSALTFNKAATKYFLAQHGIKSAPSVLVRKGEPIVPKILLEKLGLPLFVKPNNGGSSFGASKVKTPEEIIPAIEKAFAEDHEVLVETFIPATELTCGVMKVCGKEYVFAPTEIVPKKEMQKEFFDYEAKYKGLAEEITPARISEEMTLEVQQMSSRIYDILGCNGVVRIDYLLQENTLYFMEINTVPGMSEASIIPQQAQHYGMTMTELNDLLIEDALSRGK
jgi:D-alanine-D-alanine ligase